MREADAAQGLAVGLDRGGGIIALLEEIQDEHGYLPEHELRRVAAETGRSLVDVYGVATFFRAFSLTPRGNHVVSACLGTACHVRGGPSIAKELERQLGIKAGQTTPDREFTFETVNCLGACALGPVVVVDGRYHSKTRVSEVRGILERARAGVEAADVLNDSRIFPLDVRCPRCNHSLMDAHRPVDGRAAVRLLACVDGACGQLRLSSLYGSPNFASELEVSPGTLADLYCPHCQAALTFGPPCDECGAPVSIMHVEGGGVLQICSRRGCAAHTLDLSGVNLWQVVGRAAAPDDGDS